MIDRLPGHDERLDPPSLIECADCEGSGYCVIDCPQCAAGDCEHGSGGTISRECAACDGDGFISRGKAVRRMRKYAADF